MIRNPYFYFIIALIVHLLFIFPLVIMLSSNEKKLYQPFYANLPKKDFSVMPAYIAPQRSMQSPQPEKETVTKEQQKVSEKGIEKPKQTDTPVIKKKTTPLEYSAGSNSNPATAEKTYENELLRLLHEATGRALVYPRLGSGFYVTGTVKIRFQISPDGQISRAKVISSSGFGAFDEAAFRAITSISPVQGVSKYLDSPTYVTAVIMFK